MLTNKYAEGYPGKRYYRAASRRHRSRRWRSSAPRQLFGCHFANVQPQSGARRTGAVLLALLQPGDTFMGMSLDAGGHLTHGARRSTCRANGSTPVPYGVRPDDHLIDFDEVERLAQEHRPKLIIAGGSAYSRHLRFRPLPRDCRRGRRLSDGRHGAFRRPGRRRRASQPGSATPMSSPRPPTRRCAARAAAWS